MQSDEVTRQKEPERLKQIEAIREQATMLHGSRLNKDKPTEESVVKTMRDAVNEYMAAVDQDKEDGLDPDTARLWKEQVQEIVALANLDMPVAGTKAQRGAGRSRFYRWRPRTAWPPSRTLSTRRGTPRQRQPES